MTLDDLGMWYVPEGERNSITVEGVEYDGEETSLCFVDGSAFFLLCTVREAAADGPLLLKQFGADRLLLAGLHPDILEPGQVVEIERYEDGNYDVEIQEVNDAADAM